MDAIYIDLQYLELFVSWLWVVGCRGLCLWWSVECVTCSSGVLCGASGVFDDCVLREFEVACLVLVFVL